ncbi:hypothetical protein ABH931_006163 [Streptacidiphilus sp. MAP12-33]|uniref:hypothetical protein n=1 Tax=Streptacidiphilus sp. MAP12-33 TaxID=3156266 RepID=UPI003519A68D
MTAVAAQAMAWQRRMHNRPGPLGSVVGPTGGSGEQPTGGPQVEIYAGGWIDISSFVRYQQGIQVTRGQPDENQKTNPATASFRLDNRDGRFSPRNPLGPYYGIIDRNTPCRISVQSGNTKSYRFWGEIASWPQDWDGTGADAWVDVQAAGILRRLGTGQAPLRSAPYVYWANPIPGRQAVAYWPMEDASGATQFAAGVSGVQPMTITGAPSLAGYSGITASDPIASFTTGSGAYGRIPNYTPQVSAGTTLSGLTCYVAVASGGESSQTLLSVASTGTFTYEIYYTSGSGGQIGARARDGAGVVQLDTGVASLAVNGVPIVVGLDVEQADASNVFIGITLQPVNGTPGSSSVFLEIEGATYTAGRLISVKVNPTGALTGTAIGHIAVAAESSTLAIINYQGSPGDLAAVRFGNLCALVGINYHIVWNSPSGALGPNMGPMHSGAFLDLLQECVDADGGIMFELTDRLGLGYRVRDTIENQTSAVLALDYAQAQLMDVPKPVDDDTYTRNDITVTRLNGSFARAVQTSGTLNTQAPPAGVGTYATSITVNVQYDAQTADEAGRRLHLGTVAEPRYPSVGVQLARPAITGSPVLRPDALALMPGDRLSIANPPTWLPPDTISALVIGYTETFDQFLHHIQWNTTPESGYRVAVSDDTTFGHADTDGTTLAAPVTAAATSLSLATTNSASPTWTTNLADYPFDLSLGGERVTAVSPGTNLTTDPLMTAGLTNWTASNSTATPDGTYQYVTGFTPIMITPGAGQASGGINALTKTGVGTVTPAATYTVGCWVYSPQGWTDARVCFDAYDNTGAFLSSVLGNPSTVPAGVWTFLTQDLTAPASTSQALPRFRWGSTPGSGVTFWAWDITMVVDSTVTASSPQPLTVIRSVNGVVKPQAQGTAVSLYQPAILTM